MSTDKKDKTMGQARLRIVVFAVAAAALLVLAVAGPGNHRLWPRLHGLRAAGVMVEEDATGVVALAPEGSGAWRMFVNGRSHSTLPFGGLHTTLGAAPSVIHPAPREVAIIGLGSGDSAASAGCRLDIEQRITVFELYEPEHRLLSALAERNDAPVKLVQMLRDPRFSYPIADGRNALDRGGRLYDLIEADALWPTSPYAGNLYSLEFFALCARRLNPGGLVTTWAPTDRVKTTFQAALPYVVAVGDGSVLIGSRSPIPIEPEQWRRRLFDPAVIAYLGPPRVHGVWAEIAGAQALPPSPPGQMNRDLFPRDEFHSPD